MWHAISLNSKRHIGLVFSTHHVISSISAESETNNFQYKFKIFVEILKSADLGID